MLLARLPVPVLPLHRDGHVVHANRAFEYMLGHPHDALSGRSIHDFPTVSPPWPAAEDLRQSAGKVATLTHRGGSTGRRSASPSRNGRTTRFWSSCFRDVTERLWTAEPHRPSNEVAIVAGGLTARLARGAAQQGSGRLEQHRACGDRYRRCGVPRGGSRESRPSRPARRRHRRFRRSGTSVAASGETNEGPGTTYLYRETRCARI
ncbi:PAS domain-containing protein [Rhodococcus sp. WB9]|uniref:PAS domain-containing protein n=1 Tax=Rhodococcus sp. WB9 TaxID=2594007 RepID=UPI0028C3F3D8|nr:PAS domain-containing protein [Rhodococcus sp. WB9]